jgi:hypothetical protein
MAELRPESKASEPRLRREVILPPQRDAASFHRRIAIMSICIALLAGTLDALMWRAAQRQAASTAGAVPVGIIATGAAARAPLPLAHPPVVCPYFRTQ